MATISNLPQRKAADIEGGEALPMAFIGKNYSVTMKDVRDYALKHIPNTLKVYKVLSQLPTSGIVDGVPYAIGPVMVDGKEQYNIYVHDRYRTIPWVNMGFFNSASLDITQELGDSDTLVMSQRAVTEALKPIVMTEEEFNSMLERGEIADNDTTIRYIVD